MERAPVQNLIVADAAAAGANPLPLWLVTDGQLNAWLSEAPQVAAAWTRANAFQAEKNKVLMLPGPDGKAAGALVGLGALASLNDLKLWHSAGLSDRLAPGTYRLVTSLPAGAATQFALGWLVGSYRFNRYRASPSASSPSTGRAVLVAPPGADIAYAEAAAAASALARDLVNTPANDMGPLELAQAAADLAERFGATLHVTVGEALKSNNFPLIHAVGAASPREPRLIDLRWGQAEGQTQGKSGRPRVTIIGKGVCFDSGGLDIKPPAGMLLMKKDMGGAASALGVAQLLMQMQAPIQLRVLIPAVENSVDGHSYRPGDVIKSRKGVTVEIGNTDAEGRLVLADALAEADAEKPDLLIDLATLTGAARVALGPELPAAYSTDPGLLDSLRTLGDEEMDPVWPMPLWPGYDDEFSSKVADIGNVSASPFAGSPIAALFLKRFVTATPAWLHVDLFAWNPKERPGRPVGAEAQCVRSVYRLIRARFG
jgi:leucyl aminopeptidase